jgi:hypothetical protein
MTFKHKILGHEFEFRYLKWEEDPGTNRVKESLGKALVAVDDHKILSEEEALQILEALGEGPVQGIWLMYQGSAKPDRSWDALVPYKAPSVKVVQRKPLEDTNG